MLQCETDFSTQVFVKSASVVIILDQRGSAKAVRYRGLSAEKSVMWCLRPRKLANALSAPFGLQRRWKRYELRHARGIEVDGPCRNEDTRRAP